MIGRIVSIFIFFFILSFERISVAGRVWQQQNSGIIDTDIRIIDVFIGDDSFVCASGTNSLYYSKDGGGSWKEIFSLRTEEEKVNFVTFGYSDPKIIYLATSKGLFITKNQGLDWQWIFRGARDTANNVNWIEPGGLDYRKIYIGTDEGLYISQDFGESWQKGAGGLPHSKVRTIAVHPFNGQLLYLANTYGLFKSIDGGRSWRRIYVTLYKVDDEAEEDGDFSQIDEMQNLINCIAIDKENPSTIFIATGKGVLVSYDAGETWGSLAAQGLGSAYINFIVTSPGKNGSLYAATKNGVFEFLPHLNRWRHIYQGITTNNVRSLALDGEGKQLFAATDRGIFKIINIKEEVEVDRDNKIDFEEILKRLSLSEPSIAQVQEAALRYAEVVHPERIKTLRRNARLKALLPDISVDYDKTINYDSGSDRYYIGPRDWGLSLSWDVGELIFSEQIRLIDSNARLQVQLRDDILDEVTRLYYERRRLQVELILNPPQTPEEKLSKRLRLEELTANIDGLTGGYLSRQLKGEKY